MDREPSFKIITRKIGEKILGEKTEQKNETITIQEKEKINEIIIGIAGIIEQEENKNSEDLAKKSSGSSIKDAEKRLDRIKYVKENFFRGNLKDKKLIVMVENHFQEKINALGEQKMLNITRIMERAVKENRTKLTEQEESEILKIEDVQNKINDKKLDWLNIMKQVKIAKEGVAKLLEKNKAEEKVGVELKKENNWPAEFLENFLSEEQKEVLKIESDIGKISLDDNGKIVSEKAAAPWNDDDKIKQFKNKKGIIDVKELYGATMVIYNANEKIPEGCPDLRKRNHAGHIRSGEYNPETKICYVDLSNSWSFLDDKYIPQWVAEFARHELRHHLVAVEDDKHSKKIKEKQRRNLDWEHLKSANPETAKQLAYLDELYSQYFDALEGAIEGKDCFRNINSKFYSVDGEGPHLKISSETTEGKKAAKELFYYLQGMVLLKRMTETRELIGKNNIENLLKAAGVILATERTISDAKEKIRLVWNKLLSNPAIKEEFDKYIEKYKPSYSDNTPEITKELKEILKI